MAAVLTKGPDGVNPQNAAPKRGVLAVRDINRPISPEIGLAEGARAGDGTVRVLRPAGLNRLRTYDFSSAPVFASVTMNFS